MVLNGAPIYSSIVGEGPKVHVIRVGIAHQRDELIPKVQLWFRSAQQWRGDLDSHSQDRKTASV
jgi:hypothetical protein